MSFSTMLDYQRISVTKKILQRKISGFKSFKGRWLTVATGCFESVRFADLRGRACLSFDCRSGGVLGRDTLRCRQAESKNWHHRICEKESVTIRAHGTECQ